MKINIPQFAFGKILRAVVEFELIDENDDILIGISGGKDSLFLAYAMAILKKRLKKKFSLQAITINPLFVNEFNTKKISELCQSLNIPYTVKNVDIAEAIHRQYDKNPCYTCAFLRRGAINRYAVEIGCNKVAYAHHHDDAVETFFMSLIYSGQLQTFTPKTYLNRTNITVIRPLVYMREQEIVDCQDTLGITPIPSPCPYNGITSRAKTKQLIAELSKENPLLYEHLTSAMRESSLKALWPAEKNRTEMRDTYMKCM